MKTSALWMTFAAAQSASAPQPFIAIEQAKQEITSSSLSREVKNAAIKNLEEGNFSANTPGSGGAKNSVRVRLCKFLPC
jgi:hypothetical protein